MKEFTITVTSDRPASPWDSTDLMPQHAGPIQAGPPASKRENRISNVTLTAHLVDVEYSETQALLEKMKEDAKKA